MDDANEFTEHFVKRLGEPHYRDRYDIFDWFAGLAAGDAMAWIIFAAIAGCIAFFYLYEKVTGESYVKSRKERREARRRYHVLWEYRRDD